MLSVFVQVHYAECRYAECRYLKCRGAVSRPGFYGAFVASVVFHLQPDQDLKVFCKEHKLKGKAQYC
jgi:hypothetical protein